MENKLFLYCQALFDASYGIRFTHSNSSPLICCWPQNFHDSHLIQVCLIIALVQSSSKLPHRESNFQKWHIGFCKFLFITVFIYIYRHVCLASNPNMWNILIFKNIANCSTILKQILLNQNTGNKTLVTVEFCLNYIFLFILEIYC